MGFFEPNQRKRVDYSIASTNLTLGARIYHIMTPHDSHIWDWGASDNDCDGYRDGSVGDSDLWDD